METEHPFWQFSIDFYANAKVERGCLRLQEEAGGNVNLLLFSLWLATQHRVFDHQQVLANERLTYWHEQVVLPLRQARQAIKSTGEKECYEHAKQLELQAERVEQGILYELVPQFMLAPACRSMAQLVQQNLTCYLQSLPLSARQVEVFEALFAELLVVNYCK